MAGQNVSFLFIFLFFIRFHPTLFIIIWTETKNMNVDITPQMSMTDWAWSKPNLLAAIWRTAQGYPTDRFGEISVRVAYNRLRYSD